MKRLIVSSGLTAALCTSAFAQTTFKAAQFSPTPDQKEKLSRALEKYSLITLDLAAINELVERNPSTQITLELPDGIKWNVTLKQNELRVGNFEAVVGGSEGKLLAVTPEPCHTYAGEIGGDKDQYVRLFISEQKIMGMLVDKEKGAFMIEALSTFTKKNTDNGLVLYNLEDTKLNGATCGVSDLTRAAEEAMDPMTTTIRPVETTCRILEVITEADGEYHINHGSSIPNTFNDMLATINVVDGIYNATFNIRFVVVKQYMYEDPTTDPYTAAGVLDGSVIAQFKNYWNANRGSQLRDAAVFFTGKELVLWNGNQAIELFGEVPQLGTICRDLSNSYAFTTDRPFSFYTVTHEVGHLFNATHPNPNSTDCTPNRSVMCQGANLANVFFAGGNQNQVNAHLNGGDNCLRWFSSIGMFGPTRICLSAPTTYEALGGPPTINNWSWTSSPGLSLNTSTGKIVTATGTNSHNGWIQASQTFGCPITFRLNVTVGAPTVSFLVNGTPMQNGSFCAGSMQYIEAVPEDVNNSYNWSLNFGGGSLSGSGRYADFSNYDPGCSGISLHVSNSCGTTNTGLTLCAQNCLMGMQASPNPATNELTITFSGITTFDQLPRKLFVYNMMQVQPVASFDLNAANLGQTDGFSIKLDVGRLPAGLYIIRPDNPDKMTTKALKVAIR